MKLRQVALVARDLEAVVAELRAVLGIEVAYRDPGVGVFGLHNAVLPIGSTFLEVVSPLQPNTAAGRFLERRRGDGGYMVIFQCDDVDAERRHVEALGLRVVWSIDLPEARTIHLHPRDAGGAIVSFDSMTDPRAWHWAGSSWREAVRTRTVARISGVELQADDVEALATRWAALVRRPLTRNTSGGPEIQLDGSVIRFVAATDGRGDGVGGIDLAVNDRAGLIKAARDRGLEISDHVVMCGTRFRAIEM